VAVNGWIIDKSAAMRVRDATIDAQLAQYSGLLYTCEMAKLEQLYSARSASHYEEAREEIYSNFLSAAAPPDILARALRLQRDLAHHHGMWHRTPIPDLLIAETALYHELGVVHVDRDYERIAEVRPLTVRRLG
jgi:predicted nucleic acid-binding protein